MFIAAGRMFLAFLLAKRVFVRTQQRFVKSSATRVKIKAHLCLHKMRISCLRSKPRGLKA